MGCFSVCLKADEIERVAGCSHIKMFELNRPIRCSFAVAHIPKQKKKKKKNGLWFINTPLDLRIKDTSGALLFCLKRECT